MDNKIEIEYQALVDWHINNRKKKNATGIETVLQFLLDHSEKIWWWSWEFVGRTNSKGGWLSHRAPARASDLALHTDFVEDRKIGRYKVYRLRTENLKAIKEFLKQDI